MRQRIFLVVAAFLLGGVPLLAQEAQSSPPSSPYVSREEYEKLQSEMTALKEQMAELVKASKAGAPPLFPEKEAPPSVEGAPPVDANGMKSAKAEEPGDDAKTVKAADAGAAPADEIEELRSELTKVKETVATTVPGTTKFLLTGYAFGGFTNRHGEPSSFNAGFVPIFLWKLNDRLFFEGEVEFELEGDETEVLLEYAHLTYLLNDYITVGVGQFLTPFAQFPDRLHAAWINKLPDFPLVFQEEGGLIGFSQVGAQIRGAIPLGPTKILYDFYVSNGPRLNTDDVEELGTLAFNNFTDNNYAKSVGGRIGFLPIPALEVAYSVLSSSVDSNDTSQRDASVLLQAVDMSYMRDIDFLKGGIDLRAEWVWSRVSRLTYDPEGELGFGPITFNNRRNGGYAQLAYRPYKVKLPVIDKLEAVVRFDNLNQPSGAPEAFDEERWSIGFNYWLGQSTVIKAAYQIGHRDHEETGRENVDSFLIQAAMGF
jgi:hypothetical protein